MELQERPSGPFPPQVQAAAARHGIAPALAFGLGEGLNLFYRRRFGQLPPHEVWVVPDGFERRLAERLALPRREAIAAALAGNAAGVLVCTGDWHGLDAIEKWAEDLSLWPLAEGWEGSVAQTARLIEQSDGLYRRGYAAFLDEAATYLDGLAAPRALLPDIADEWLDIATRLRQGDALDRLGSRLLRMAARESRFWGLVQDQVGRW